MNIREIVTEAESWLSGMKTIPVAYVSVQDQQGVAEGKIEEQSNLVSQFLKSISPKELRYYSIRDNCGPAAMDMRDWAQKQGIDLKRHRGYFVADNVVYDKADFTKEMKRDFLKQGLDFNDPNARKEFIESNPEYSEEWKKVPHYWLQDKQGNIYDPTGYIQFIKTGLARDLDSRRYLSVNQGVAEGVNDSRINNKSVHKEINEVLKPAMDFLDWCISMTNKQQDVAEGLDEAESHTPASKEIRTSLRKSGYKLLGSGADATVWAKRAGPVIKIIMPDSGHGAGHTGDTFMKFYEFCKHNSELQNLPKFSDPPAEEFKIGHKKYIAVFMERLSPIPVGSFQEAMVWILSELATRPISWRQALRIVGYKKTWKHYNDGMHPHHILQTLAELSQEELLEYEVLFKLMTLLYHKGKINKTGWDLHTENAMMRDNTIVITDPWFTSKI